MHFILVYLVEKKARSEVSFLLVVDEIIAPYRSFFYTILWDLICLVIILVIDLFYHFFTLLKISFTRLYTQLVLISFRNALVLFFPLINLLFFTALTVHQL